VHSLTFDVEEHFQVSAFDSPAMRSAWEQSTSRVERSTERILALLHAEQVQATFFVLGWVAERHKSLIRSIVAQGHEVASHGYAHEMVTTQTPDQFRADVGRAKKILEDVIGKPVLGYRAPSFTITRQTEWALQILVEEGYRYDSSIFPIVHDRYGMPGAPVHCHERATAAGGILEIPPSTVQFGGVKVPVAGGGYFRLCPYPVFHHLLTRAAATGHPLVMYFHPWEFDPQQPRMDGGWLARFRHYINLDKTEERVSRLLRDFSFAPICESIQPIKVLCDDGAVGYA
jgi:polysaccharide deacetylase family protein (PEP-CTERM system associated)